MDLVPLACLYARNKVSYVRKEQSGLGTLGLFVRNEQSKLRTYKVDLVPLAFEGAYTYNVSGK